MTVCLKNHQGYRNNVISQTRRASIIGSRQGFSGLKLLSGLIIWLFSTGVFAEPLTFSVDHFPPFTFMNEKGKVEGVDVEIVQRAFERRGLNTQIRQEPWKRGMKNAQRGRIYGLISCMYSRERAEHLLFSDPVSFTTQGALTRIDYNGPPLQKFNDLQNVHLTLMDGWQSEREISKLGWSASLTNRIESALNIIIYRDISALYISLETGMYNAHRLGLSDQIKAHRLVDRPARPLYICVSKKYPGARKYLDQFNQGLSEMKRDGEYQRIFRKYGVHYPDVSGVLH